MDEQIPGMLPGDSPPLEEQVTEQYTIVFQGDTLNVVATNHLAFYVSIPSVCMALDLNVKGQIQRIKRTPVLEDGLRLLPMETNGGIQRMSCMHVEWIDYWLGSIRLKGVHPSLTKIDTYRRELPSAVYDVFHRIGSLQGQPWLATYMQQTPSPFEVAETIGEDPLLEQKLPTGCATR